MSCLKQLFGVFLILAGIMIGVVGVMGGHTFSIFAGKGVVALGLVILFYKRKRTY